ncbi:MAG: hypothetical protein AAF208_11155 [Cyanobacteria bacterium P01_A01_bin.45]
MFLKTDLLKCRTYATGTLRSPFSSIFVLERLVTEISPFENC